MSCRLANPARSVHVIKFLIAPFWFLWYLGRLRHYVFLWRNARSGASTGGNITDIKMLVVLFAVCLSISAGTISIPLFADALGLPLPWVGPLRTIAQVYWALAALEAIGSIVWITSVAANPRSSPRYWAFVLWSITLGLGSGITPALLLPFFAPL